MTGMPVISASLFGPAGVAGGEVRLQRLASILAHESTGPADRAMVSAWEFPERVADGASELATPFMDPRYAGAVDGEIPAMMLLDAATYLPDDILVKVDRASMAVSLEVRCRRSITDFSSLRGGCLWASSAVKISGKWILSSSAAQAGPARVADRPKAGFAVPIQNWIRGPLREWAADLLDPPNASQ